MKEQKMLDSIRRKKERKKEKKNDSTNVLYSYV